MNLLAFVPARSGSKGIPNKNIISLCGRPLLSYTVDAIRSCPYISSAVLSTDSPEYADLGRSLGLDVPFLRPPSLSKDTTTSLSVLQHYLVWHLDHYDGLPDLIAFLQPTSPLRTSNHITSCIDIFDPHLYNSLVTVQQVPHNMTPESQMIVSDNGLKNFIPSSTSYRRQDKKSYLARNGAAVYLLKPSLILNASSFLSEPIQHYCMDPISSLDIDTYHDLYLAESILKNPLSSFLS